MQKVYSHENLAIVNSARNLLELRGINCFIKNEYHASGGHVGLGAVPIELWVYDSGQADNAISILKKELDDSSDKPQWTCSNCGELNDGAFDFCWKCQEPATTPGH